MLCDGRAASSLGSLGNLRFQTPPTLLLGREDRDDHCVETDRRCGSPACLPVLAAARLSKEVAVVGRPSQGKTRLKIKPT